MLRDCRTGKRVHNYHECWIDRPGLRHQLCECEQGNSASSAPGGAIGWVREAAGAAMNKPSSIKRRKSTRLLLCDSVPRCASSAEAHVPTTEHCGSFLRIGGRQSGKEPLKKFPPGQTETVIVSGYTSGSVLPPFIPRYLVSAPEWLWRAKLRLSRPTVSGCHHCADICSRRLHATYLDHSATLGARGGSDPIA